MDPLKVDVLTIYRAIGFVYFVLPATVWFVLRSRQPRAHLLAWCLGGVAFGAGNMVLGLRDLMLEPWAVLLGCAAMYLSYPLRAGALRLEMGRPVHAPWMAAGWLGSVLLLLAAQAGSLTARHLVNTALQLAGTTWLTVTAVAVWRSTRLPSARLIAFGHGSLLLAACAMVLQLVLDKQGMELRGDQLATVLTAAAGVVAAACGSLGYVGLAIEKAHRQELARAEELAREAAQRHAAETHAQQLKGWLDEREELIRLMAHEVRQPLNNAMAALHATHQALATQTLDFQAVTHRVRRAERVLARITGTLDNTLAATALLASPDRVEPRDVDVDTVTALSIGDLSPELRSRVQLHRVSQVRTATMDAGLMRLALRNLLSNAGIYAPSHTPVVLRVTDSDEPLGLVFAVIDQGPGIAPELAQHLFQRGVRGERDGGGHGLGLYVVRRVIELHGGTVDVAANPGGGAIFRLTLPQTDTAFSARVRRV